MGNPGNPDDGDLSASTEDEYGGGTELTTAGFLVLGLLTFWIYTVFKYHQVLCHHIAGRLAHFSVDRDLLSAESRAHHDLLVERGFTCRTGPRNVSLSLYAASLTLILAEVTSEFLVLQGRISQQAFETFVYLSVGGASLLFCAASLHFMWWVARSMREHEYHELLLARFVSDPPAFRMVQPSAKFTARWNRSQSRVALFLVLAVPMTISPMLAVRQIQEASLTGSSFAATLVGWTGVLFLFGAIFHLLGTRILLDMYNGHLRVEAVNREMAARTSPWLPERTQAVLDEGDGGEPFGGPGELSPRRVVASIMITDMVGYSREMQQSEDRTVQKLMKHNQLVRAQLARHGGHEIKTMGDAFLVSFKTPLDAVKAALDIQRELSAYNTDRERMEQIVIRIGIHTGEILALDRDVLGTGVNIAARIEPLAEPGGICISSATYEGVRLEVDIHVFSLGHKELKNIANAPEIFRVVRDTGRDSLLPQSTAH